METPHELAQAWNAWWDVGVRLVAVETWDEGLAQAAANALAEMREVPLWQWSAISGLTRSDDVLGGALTRDADIWAEKVLAMPAGVVLARDLWHAPLDHRALRALRDVAHRSAPVFVIATSAPGCDLPEMLRHDMVRMPVGGPRGPLTSRWAESGIPSLQTLVHRQETRIPGLDWVQPAGDWSQVGGLERLKAWADERRLALDPARGLPFPRGVLLYGIPGTGKSVSVRAWAGSWNLPLLRLDWGGLMGRYVGQSESRLAAALKAAEDMAPAVLWMDELEKGVGADADGHDSGVSRRLTAHLLTWLQEHEAPVLLLATANSMQGLPPELLRPGRFDALFFVDLPDAGARREILAIHLRRHGVLDPTPYLGIADVLEDFSGADLASAVIESLFRSAVHQVPLTPAVLAEASASIVPWARTLGEELAQRRAWAKGRLLPA